MKKILALALFGLTAVVPITAIPVAAQTVAAEQTVAALAADAQAVVLDRIEDAQAGVGGVAR